MWPHYEKSSPRPSATVAPHEGALLAMDGFVISAKQGPPNHRLPIHALRCRTRPQTGSCSHANPNGERAEDWSRRTGTGLAAAARPCKAASGPNHQLRCKMVASSTTIRHCVTDHGTQI